MPSLAQRRNEMQRMKTQWLIHATRVKKTTEQAAGPDKPTGNGKRINARKAMDSHGSGARTRFKHHLLVPNQYMGDGPWVKGKRGCGLAMGRRRSLFCGFRLSSFGGNVLLRWHSTQKRQTWAEITRCIL